MCLLVLSRIQKTTTGSHPLCDSSCLPPAPKPFPVLPCQAAWLLLSPTGLNLPVAPPLAPVPCSSRIHGCAAFPPVRSLQGKGHLGLAAERVAAGAGGQACRALRLRAAIQGTLETLQQASYSQILMQHCQPNPCKVQAKSHTGHIAQLDSWHVLVVVVSRAPGALNHP